MDARKATRAVRCYQGYSLMPGCAGHTFLGLGVEGAMELSEATAAVAALASVGAALWARSSAVTAKKALALAKHDSRSREEELSLYLVDALRWNEQSLGACLSVSCTVTNGSATPTTINRVELVMHAYGQDGMTQSVLIPARSVRPQDSDFSLIELPLNLNARASVSGWLSFRFPESTRGLRAERYEVVFHTWSGQKSVLDIYQVKSVL